jgi:hypothetical protein
MVAVVRACFTLEADYSMSSPPASDASGASTIFNSRPIARALYFTTPVKYEYVMRGE